VVTSFRLIAGLIGASPIFIFQDGALARALLGAYVAVVVICVALDLRPGEGGHLAKVFRPIAIAALIPAVWMLVQVLPLPISGLLHPIWLSARDALKDATLGSISIDSGASLVALSRYLTVAGIALASAAVTIDRQRAEWMLMGLAIVATLVAVVLVVHRLGGLFFLSPSDGAAPAASMDAISALGVIVTTAAAIRAFERFETRRSAADMSFLKFSRSFVYCLVGFAICWGAILFFAARPVIFAAACGFATLVWVVVARRVGLGPWSRAATAVAGIGAAAFVTLSQWGPQNVGFSLRFAAFPSPALISTAQRILSEATWMGSGAGSFAALTPIYRSGDDVVVNGFAPTAAAGIAIELGWLGLCAIVLIAAFVCMLLLRGALQRGRDSFYATAAAGGVVLITVEAFCDASLAGVAASTVAAVLLGLGIAQSVSRTVQ
jgi:hypothetical protein